MSVLFSDIRDFTTLSESLSTHQLKQFLNQYLTPMTEIIFDHKGTIDKYVGDMVMAFWGAPIENKNHAQDAVLTALSMKKKLVSMSNYFHSLGLEKISAGFGVNTGEMNVGDMGSNFRRSYTVLGDAVNLGSRLESLTKFYGISILVSEQTQKACEGIVFRYIDNVRVKGKHEAIRIYEPLGVTGQKFEFDETEQELYIQAIEKYLDGNWKAAQIIFFQLDEFFPCLLYERYLERIQSTHAIPPLKWNKVFEHHSK